MSNVIINLFVCCNFLIGSYAFANQNIEVEAGKTTGEKGIEAFRQGNLMLAMQLLNDSAAKGYTPAQTTLGYILDQAEENQRAFELFKKAAEKNDPAGQFGLGNMYAKGEGTDKDKVLAGQWIKKSALQNHAPAMRAYAYALEYGNLGFEQNSNQAFQWYTRCSQANDVVCSRRLIEIYTNGELGQAVNVKKSIEFKNLLDQPVKEKK